MSIKDEKQLEKAYRYAKVSLEFEGFTFTKEDEFIIKSVLSGRKTRKELIKELKQGI